MKGLHEYLMKLHDEARRLRGETRRQVLQNGKGRITESMTLSNDAWRMEFLVKISDAGLDMNCR